MNTFPKIKFSKQMGLTTARAVFGFTMIASTGSPANAEPTRREEANRATAEFSRLHFFSDGMGMHTSPNLTSIRPMPMVKNRSIEDFRRGFEKIARDRWGLPFDDGKLAGFFNVIYKEMQVGVMGCVVCHSSKAAGQYIVGLGNKNIDVEQLARDIQKVEKTWKHVARPEGQKSADYLQVEASALDMAEYLQDTRIGNLTQGLVPISLIQKWFYRQAGQSMEKIRHRGQVKVPSLWGYGKKRLLGQFCDGFGDGNVSGWAVAVELAAGQNPQVVRGYMQRVDEAEKLLDLLVPTPYPFAIDRDLTATGKRIFEESCANCHGTYTNDAEGLPIYVEPKFIPIEVVQTDMDRLLAPNEEFRELVRGNVLNDLIRFNDRPKGYFAPRLHGIWARFPYLHNGSVPTLMDLLNAPEDRPEAFSLIDAGELKRFDPVRGGLTVPKRGSPEAARLLLQGATGQRSIYDARRTGQGHSGHNFYTKISSEDKKALIAYLKTL
jgi:mono/diheme cytochrome c family protein